MSNNNPSPYSYSQGVQLLEKTVHKYGPIFTLKQISSIPENKLLSPIQIRKLISKLSTSGWIEILKRGTYVATRSLFSGEISPFGIAAALVQPMAISYWSALAHHGFTTQNPTMIQATTTHKVITPEMRLGNAYSPRGRAVWRAHKMEFEFIYTQPNLFWGFEKMWIGDWYQIDITDPERTALDLIIRPDIFGGFSAATEILEGTLLQINIMKLVDYALRYNNGSVIKRLGWLLEQMNVDPVLLLPLLNYPIKRYVPLDASQSKERIHNLRWKIIENIKKA